ncbi:hypothetical protein NFI96_022175 [Prochilodus magdalenae]|nr:hypothetical protein NFI96_022175 [Prochilodus magdalenae]
MHHKVILPWEKECIRIPYRSGTEVFVNGIRKSSFLYRMCIQKTTLFVELALRPDPPMRTAKGQVIHKTSPEKTEEKQPMCLSLNVPEMMKRRFWPPKLEDTFTFSAKSNGLNLHGSSRDEVSNTTNTYTLPDGNEMCVSWENQAVEEIMRLANFGHESLQGLYQKMTTTITVTPSGSCVTIFKNGGFQQYAQTVWYLIHRKREQMNAASQENKKTAQKQDSYLQIGKYVLKLQGDDLYIVPQYTLHTDGHHQTIEFNKRNLSYVRLKPTNTFNKKYSETLYNYVIGNHTKVNCSVKSPEDAIAIGAVLFSEVIRNPEMFFHNIVLIYPLKSWDDFCLHHPMVTGGSWKLQADSKNLPKKVTEKMQDNLRAFVQRFLREKSFSVVAG